MAYAKTYNPGRVKLDLPLASYTYELPLFSIGDLFGGFQLSLLYNYAFEQEEGNVYSLRAGYKFNLQKRLIKDAQGDIICFEDEIGTQTSVSTEENLNYYFFDDDTQRLIYPCSSGYELVYPDGSKDVFNTSGKITGIFDKYGINVVAFAYANGYLQTINYRSGKIITISYQEGHICGVSYGDAVISFNYSNNCLSVVFPSSEIVHIQTTDTSFTATAGEYDSTNGTTSNRRAVAVVTDTVNATLRLSNIAYEGENYETANETEYTVYGFKCGFGHNTYADYVDITDRYGVTNRIQYYGKHPRFAYEIMSGDDPFIVWLSWENLNTYRFAGNVKLLSYDDVSGEPHVVGMQQLRDGDGMGFPDSNGKWRYDTTSRGTPGNGYYVVSGWARSTTYFWDNDITTIHVTSQNGVNLDLSMIGQWIYFSLPVKSNLTEITVYHDYGTAVELRDLRVTYQQTTVDDAKADNHITMQEDGLVYHANNTYKFLPLNECDFSFYDNQTPPSVYFEDLLTNKLHYMRGVHTTDFFFDKMNDVNPYVNASTGVTFTHGNTTYYLNQCYLAKRRFVDNHGYVTTRMVDDNTSSFFIVETVDNSGNIIYSQRLNDKLDVTQTFDGDTYFQYTRDSYGRVTGELAHAGYVIYNRLTGYSHEEGADLITTTNEFGKSTVYRFGNVWGELISVTTPDSTVVTNEYDDAKSILTKRTVGANGRSNSLGYCDGFLSALTTGSLSYSFTYQDDMLAAVAKQGTTIEEYTHTDTRTCSYFPSIANKSYKIAANFDKYQRITSIDGEITNEYDVISAFEENGTRRVVKNCSDALLVLSTDEVTSQTSRYSYDLKDRLTSISISEESDADAGISNETFAYDKINRITSQIFKYGSADNDRIESSIVYQKADNNPTADGKVDRYSYRVKGNDGAVTTVEYGDDGFYEGYHTQIGDTIFYAYPIYDKTRIYRIENFMLLDTFTEIGEFGYTYDSMGRILTDSFSSNTSLGYSREYGYDAYGQLTLEDPINTGAITYSYDSIGNIVSVKKYANGASPETSTNFTETTFAYDSTYPDRLVSFNGKSISYNSLGCISSYNGESYSWSKGRLSFISKGKPIGNLPYNSCSFSYDGSGRRISKSYTYDSKSTLVFNSAYSYDTTYTYDHSGRLIREYCVETSINEGGTVTHELFYIYDDRQIVGVYYSCDGAALQPYFYQRNLMGDVIAIYAQDGTKVVEYCYDAFGNCTVTDSIDSPLATYNPILYRGYYYDRETKLYYLNSRYYNPEWRRFISPDAAAYLDPESVNGLNLYAYCGNDPLNFVDPSGHAPEWLQGLAIGLAAVGAVLVIGAVTALTMGVGTTIITTTMAGAVIHGAAVGTLIGAGIGTVVGGIVGGAVSDWSCERILIGMGIGLGAGAIIGAIAGGGVGAFQYTSAVSRWGAAGGRTAQQNMIHHFNKHVIKEGHNYLGQNVIQYTKNARDFFKINSSLKKLTNSGNYAIRATFAGHKVGGFYNATGIIFSFF